PRSEISTRSRRDLAEINCPGGDRISTGSESLRYQLLYKDGVSAVNCIRRMSLHVK
ncbi:hypothetical protein Tco_0334267, partial [Tanacetum coccineum]